MVYTGTGPVHGVKTITLNGVSRTCAYDPNGNMVTSPDFTNATNPLNRTIAYDGDNMPTRIVHANGKTVDFVYDGATKRTKKLVQSGKTVLYLGDHFEVENGVNIKYIFGGNLRLAQIKGSLTSSSTSYFHKDHLGSTAAVTGEDGLKKESTTYEPFGSTRTQEGTAVSAYKFTDQELDNETGLYNYDARLYDPVLGMFVTPDSIVPGIFDPQSFNRYTYCRNNPLIYVDPTGHDVEGGGGSHWGTTGQANYDKNPFVPIEGWAKERYHRSAKICDEREQRIKDEIKSWIISYMEFQGRIALSQLAISIQVEQPNLAQININRIEEACKKAFESEINKAACNFFVEAVAKELGISLSGTANEIAKQIQKDWSTAKDALDATVKAKEGKFVLGFLENPDGSGHIVVVNVGTSMSGTLGHSVPNVSYGALNSPDLARLNTAITNSFRASRYNDIKYSYIEIP